MAEPSALAAKLLEGIAKEGGSKALTAIFGGLSKFRDALRMNFSDYIDSAVDRASHVKTLLHRDDRVSLFSIYVETFLKSDRTVVRDDKLINTIRQSSSTLVIGSAGTGKTMFIRYLFMQLVEGNFGILPILIELRGLNSVEYKDDLIQFIYESVVRPGAVVSKEQFNDCLRENMFILILDGLDEVEHDRRPNVERQIANLREAYPKLSIVVASRPDDRLTAWAKFRVYHIQPMNKVQVTKLIGKLPYDRELRKRFIDEVDKNLYERHASFLSNPLLATMMLMTFDQFAEIPDKIHIFYEQAFETLFFRHDTGKQAAFRRKMYTDLAINDFKNCLSALCVSSYFKRKLSFSEAEILEYIRTATQSEKLLVVERHYLMDLLESVCILQRDGLFITFSHRSFQEYFAAFYISRSPQTDMGRLLDKFSARVPSDNVIPMVFDMNRPLIEREWILPRITDLARQIRKVKVKNNIIELANAIGLSLLLQTAAGGELLFTPSDPCGHFVCTLNNLYQDVLGNQIFVNFSKNDRPIIHAMLKQRKISTLLLDLERHDQEWMRHTSLAKSVPRALDALLELAAMVKTSVSQQEKLVGVLFE